MTKLEQKKFDEWAVGKIDHKASLSDVDYEEGGDLITGLDSLPRVVYLRSLCYKFDSWEGYAQAEINEMGSDRLI
jgi:hypothetical protein